MKLIVVAVFLCIAFGSFGNVNSDQQKGVEILTLPTVVEKTDGPHERSGYALRPGKPLARPNPYNVVVCYACTNCKDVQPDTYNKLCPYTPDARKQGKCVSYVERSGVQSTDLVHVRGCASDRGTCSEIKSAYERAGKYVELVTCNECQGDKCNGAPKSMVNMAVAFITVAILPLLGKCTLS